jgi:hypothetical protein
MNISPAPALTFSQKRDNPHLAVVPLSKLFPTYLIRMKKSLKCGATLRSPAEVLLSMTRFNYFYSRPRP